MKTTILAMACFLAGCATQKNIYLPDGRQGFSIACNGAALSWDLCYEKAGQICKNRGYEILSREGEESPLLSATEYGVLSGSSVKRSLVITCKEGQ